MGNMSKGIRSIGERRRSWGEGLAVGNDQCDKMK